MTSFSNLLLKFYYLLSCCLANIDFSAKFLRDILLFLCIIFFLSIGETAGLDIFRINSKIILIKWEIIKKSKLHQKNHKMLKLLKHLKNKNKKQIIKIIINSQLLLKTIHQKIF